MVPGGPRVTENGYISVFIYSFLLRTPAVFRNEFGYMPCFQRKWVLPEEDGFRCVFRMAGCAWRAFFLLYKRELINQNIHY